MATSPRAIPVRTRVRTMLQMCIEADPDFIEDGLRPIAYEFNNGKRKFRENANRAGIYAPDE